MLKQDLKNNDQESEQKLEIRSKQNSRLDNNYNKGIFKHVSTSPNKTLFGAILNSDRPNKPCMHVNVMLKKKPENLNEKTKFKANEFLSSKLSRGNRMLKK